MIKSKNFSTLVANSCKSIFERRVIFLTTKLMNAASIVKNVSPIVNARPALYYLLKEKGENRLNASLRQSIRNFKQKAIIPKFFNQGLSITLSKHKQHTCDGEH